MRGGYEEGNSSNKDVRRKKGHQVSENRMNFNERSVGLEAPLKRKGRGKEKAEICLVFTLARTAWEANSCRGEESTLGKREQRYRHVRARSKVQEKKA